MLRWIRRSATGRRLLALTFMMLVFTLMILPWVMERFAGYSRGGHPIDVNVGFAPADAYATLEALGAEGRTFYLLFQITGDIVWPLVYALFLSTLLAWLFARGFSPSSPVQRFIIVPFLVLAADYAENLGILAMILAYPARLDAVAQLTSILQTIKWALTGVCGLLVLVGAAAALARRGGNR
ncbi:MAG: hypothetical protein KatS3mg060_3439 [Dehalococcoidia bacterium]|jgi:hypothetical protein|nr:MAG: hypothetical protein KatS3mg060_3439 [Dehalococcoidia bacterium]